MFAKRLKELREQLNISQTQLANDLNLSRSTISSYELNKRQPDFEILEQLADYFNVSIDYLLGRSNLKTFKEYIADTDFKVLLEKLKDANSETRNITVHIIDNLFLTLFNALSDNELELLEILNTFYSHIYKLNFSFKENSKVMFFKKLFNDDINETLSLQDKLKVLSECKTQCNSAMDDLLQYYIEKDLKSN